MIMNVDVADGVVVTATYTIAIAVVVISLPAMMIFLSYCFVAQQVHYACAVQKYDTQEENINTPREPHASRVKVQGYG